MRIIKEDVLSIINFCKEIADINRPGIISLDNISHIVNWKSYYVVVSGVLVHEQSSKLISLYYKVTDLNEIQNEAKEYMKGKRYKPGYPYMDITMTRFGRSIFGIIKDISNIELDNLIERFSDF